MKLVTILEHVQIMCALPTGSLAKLCAVTAVISPLGEIKHMSIIHETKIKSSQLVFCLGSPAASASPS